MMVFEAMEREDYFSFLESIGLGKKNMMWPNQTEFGAYISHRIHVWYIYLHLPYFTIKNNQM